MNLNEISEYYWTLDIKGFFMSVILLNLLVDRTLVSKLFYNLWHLHLLFIDLMLLLVFHFPFYSLV